MNCCLNFELSSSRPVKFLIFALVCHFVAFQVPANEGKASDFDDFLRYVELGEESGKVETGIVTYRNLRGVEVQLIGAVHVGEAEYYSTLQKRFSEMDALLYEMVKPAGVDPSQLKRSDSGVSMIQRMMKNALKLQFQLDAVDYSPSNFVHADMTPEAFEKAQGEQGESLSGLMFETMMQQHALMTPGDAVRENLRFLAALTNKNRSHALKLYLGKQIGDMEKAVIGLDGKPDEEGNTNGSVLLHGRNEVAIRVLREQINFKRHRKIGIFYGAAHMPDMEKRLLNMGFRKVRSEWLTAWDMSK